MQSAGQALPGSQLGQLKPKPQGRVATSTIVRGPHKGWPTLSSSSRLISHKDTRMIDATPDVIGCSSMLKVRPCTTQI